MNKPRMWRSTREGGLSKYQVLRGWGGASLVAQMVKNLSAMWETRVQSLGGEDPLEEGTATPLQYSGLENPMDRGAWRAAVHRDTQGQTRLSN